MVSALKTQDNTKSRFDSLIQRFSGDTKKGYVSRDVVHKKPYVDRSVQKLAVNSIIEGYFPKENLVKDMAIKNQQLRR